MGDSWETSIGPSFSTSKTSPPAAWAGSNFRHCQRSGLAGLAGKPPVAAALPQLDLGEPPASCACA